MENVTNWYDAVPYADIKNIIRDRVTAMAREYIGIGFFLRKVRDNEMYLEDGYKDIHDFAMNEFGMSKSTVNHCIRINEQFSIDGNSPGIDERYKDFSKSQLQEMLYIPGRCHAGYDGEGNPKHEGSTARCRAGSGR